MITTADVIAGCEKILYADDPPSWFWAMYWLRRATPRLINYAAYEGTGLTPEEVAELCRRCEAAEGPLTLNQLRAMNDEPVIVRYPGLKIAALVSYNPKGSEDYNECDGDAVWLTNSLGGRNMYEDIIADGGVVFGHDPQGQEGVEHEER